MVTQTCGYDHEFFNLFYLEVGLGGSHKVHFFLFHNILSFSAISTNIYNNNNNTYNNNNDDDDDDDDNDNENKYKNRNIKNNNDNNNNNNNNNSNNNNNNNNNNNREVFAGTAINVTTEGHKHLGAAWAQDLTSKSM